MLAGRIDTAIALNGDPRRIRVIRRVRICLQKVGSRGRRESVVSRVCIAMLAMMCSPAMVAANAPLLRLLSPRNGTHLAPNEKWAVEASISGITNPSTLLVLELADEMADLSSSVAVVPITNGHSRYLLPGLAKEQIKTFRATLMLPGALHNVTLYTVSAQIVVRIPSLSIFHPIDNEPALIAAGRPLVVNFGLTTCLTGVPDCYVEFQGAQYTHARIFFNDALVATIKKSRAHVSLEQLPADFWINAKMYSKPQANTQSSDTAQQAATAAHDSEVDYEGALQQEATLTVALISREDGREVLFKSKPLTLVTPAGGEGVRAGGGSEGGARGGNGWRGVLEVSKWRRHVYVDAPMNSFGDTWHDEVQASAAAFWQQPQTQQGVSPFFTTWNARADLR